MAGSEAMNCPFYGHSMFFNIVLPPRFLLIDSGGNQCALITDAHSPCMLEINGQEVEWRLCPRVREARMGTRR